jgi:periplasmic mercuric ion binding protein
MDFSNAKVFVITQHLIFPTMILLRSVSKRLTLLMMMLLSATITLLSATSTFKVSGNCGMCKKKIETQFKGVEGVESATWNKSTKMFSITYDSTKITLPAIHEKISSAGYDTETTKGNDEAYSKLPNCCKYRDVKHD